MDRALTVHDLLQHYHEQKVIDLDVPLRELVKAEVIGSSNPNGLPTDILLGPRFFFVTLVERQGFAINPARLAAIGRQTIAAE